MHIVNMSAPRSNHVHSMYSLSQRQRSKQIHVVNISEICPFTVSLSATGAQHPTAILGWREAMCCSTTLSYQSCIECYNSKLGRYRLILGCQLFKFEN